MNDCDNAIKMVSIPINPNSVGDKIRAKTIPAINCIPWLEKLSIKLQIVPEIVFCFNVIILN